MFRKYIAAIAAVLLIAIQVLPGITLASSVNTWQGNTWQGETWESPTWEGPTWDGNTTDGEGWSGDSHQLDRWSGQGNGAGLGHQGNGFDGRSHQGSPYLFQPGYGIDGFHGQDFRGLPGGPAPIHDHPPFQGVPGSQLGASIGSGIQAVAANPPGRVERSDPWDGYDLSKLFIDDFGMGTIDLVAELASLDDGGFGPYGMSRAGMFVSGYNVLTKGHEGAQAVGDLMSIGVDTVGTLSSFNDFRQLTLGTAGTEAAMLSQASNASRAVTPAVSTLAKVNAVTGVVGLGFSTVDFVRNVSHAANSSGAERTDAIVDSVGSAGGMLMSSGAIVAAIPGAQAVGVGMMAVGGAISIGAAAVRFFRREPVREAVSNGWKKVKGFFGFGS